MADFIGGVIVLLFFFYMIRKKCEGISPPAEIGAAPIIDAVHWRNGFYQNEASRIDSLPSAAQINRENMGMGISP